MRIKYSRKALIDLDNIARYGEAEWGAEQARSYLENIGRRVRYASQNRLLGSGCGLLRDGYRKISFGSHLIFYKANEEYFEVIRILPERMDVMSQLS